MADSASDGNIDLHIEREVQRRLARQVKHYTDEIAELQAIVQDARNNLVRQHNIISRLTSEPLAFGTLLKVHNLVDPTKFKAGDEIIVIDQASPHYQKGGRIIDIWADGKNKCVENGKVWCKLTDETEIQFSIGVEGYEPAQIRLTQKDDGTFAVVQIDGKPWEVRGVPDLELKPGAPVKVKPDSKQIICAADPLLAGPICTVVAILDDCVEVMHKGDKQIVYNPNGITLEEGDRVATDPSLFAVVKKLPADARNRYKVTSDLTLTWDDIGGLEGAKQEMMDALELPFQHPDLFNFYGVQPLRGILLYGPPGNGKTLLARVAAWSVANIHGKSAIDTGYIYVKAPEILDKWVGNTEKEIRDLFERGRRHYREHGYKAILAIDEADAIMPQRGTRRSSDISDTIVPMFLGEMDGIDSRQTAENPIIVLMTNRADVLDPAVTRAGRISRHIKIDRPNDTAAVEILKIHTKNIPFADEKERLATMMLATSDLFSKSRLLYRLNNEFDFTLGDCVNGAMLANIAEIAKLNALHRDLTAKTQTGVNSDDFRQAIQKVYRQQRGVNHSYDLADFAEKLGIHAEKMQVDRCFGAA